MEYLKLFFYNRRLLSFGILLTFFSGFGKTFLIALYIKDFKDAFGLTTPEFSVLYAAATLMGAFIFMYVGKFIDRLSIQHYTLFVVAGVCGSCLSIAMSSHIFFLAIGIIGLRLAGQSLLTHISLTAMSQKFHLSRGKAVSLALLGQPLGEALLPVLACYLIHFYNWRISLIVSAGILMIILVPAAFILLRGKLKPIDVITNYPVRKKMKKGKKTWTVKKLIMNRRFRYIAPSMMTLAFLNAGILFFLVPMAQEKGWTEQWIIHSFVAFGIGSFSAGILMGTLIDRHKASHFFPYYLMPYALGIFLFILFSSSYIALIFLLLAGITVGMGSSIESNLLAEVYGTRSLGQVRSIYTCAAVCSAAIGPLCLGLLHENHTSFPTLLKIGLVFIAISSLLSLKLRSGSAPKSGLAYRLRFLLNFR